MRYGGRSDGRSEALYHQVPDQRYMGETRGQSDQRTESTQSTTASVAVPGVSGEWQWRRGRRCWLATLYVDWSNK